MNKHVTLTGTYTGLDVYNPDSENGVQFSFYGAEDLPGIDPATFYGGALPGLVVSRAGREGSRKAGIPDEMYSVYGMFSFDGMLAGLTSSIGATHVAEVYSGFSKVLELPSYTLLNASIHYETTSWKFGLQGKNLTNERYFRSNFPDLFGAAVVLPELPRSFLVSASYKF